MDEDEELQRVLMLSMQSYTEEQRIRPKQEFKPIYRLDHCQHMIYSFSVMEDCTFCKMKVISSNNLFLMKYESELIKSEDAKMHILIKCTLGSFQDYSKVSQIQRNSPKFRI